MTLAGLSKLKTYFAAAGLIGLAVYQASVGQYELAVQSALAALAVIGLRHETAPRPTPPAPPTTVPDWP